MVTKQKKKSNFLTILIILTIAIAAGYFYSVQPDNKDKYKVRAAGGDETAWKASFINLTGRDAEDKKIGLSDDYWEGGKFK